MGRITEKYHRMLNIQSMFMIKLQEKMEFINENDKTNL